MAVTPALVIVTSPVTAAAVGTPLALPTRILALASEASLLNAMAAEELISALTMVLSAIIVPVTVPVSPVVTTVPVMLGKVMVLSNVGSTTAKVVSKPSAVEPSNVRLPVVPISKLPVMMPPDFGNAALARS